MTISNDWHYAPHFELVDLTFMRTDRRPQASAHASRAAFLSRRRRARPRTLQSWQLWQLSGRVFERLALPSIQGQAAALETHAILLLPALKPRRRGRSRRLRWRAPADTFQSTGSREAWKSSDAHQQMIEASQAPVPADIDRRGASCYQLWWLVIGLGHNFHCSEKESRSP